MELTEIKEIVDVYRAAGKSREETVAIISAITVNGGSSDIFEYCDMVFKSTTLQGDFNLTDAGNSEYFNSQHGINLRYDHRRHRWLEWHKHYWRPDSDGHIMRIALQSIRDRYLKAVDIEDQDVKKNTAKWALGSEARSRIDATVGLARDMKPIAESGESWDKDPWLLATPGGVIELKTGNVRPGKQEDLITMVTPVAYQTDAEAPLWVRFLNDIFEGDNELIYWLQKYFGYALTGITREQIIPIGYGRGANGKTVLLAVTRYAIGDYAYDAPFSTFEINNRSAIPNDIAALDGKRFVTSSETTEGARFNEARIKALTGCDSMTARFLHAEYFTFQPVAKFFLAVNNRPRVHDDSYGFWRRVRLIPFTQRFIGKGDDKELTHKLIAEAPGILNWMVKGCLLWQKEGMEPTPDCITMATREYESESDPLSEFILDECVMSTQAHANSSQLYKNYKEWCRDQGMIDKEILTLNAFGRRMGQKFKKTHQRDGAVYSGLGMKCDGFVTEYEANDISNELNSNIDTRVIDNSEKPSHSVNPSHIGSSQAQSDGFVTEYCELPEYPEKPCPKCGSEWQAAPDGKGYICEKGHREK